MLNEMISKDNNKDIEILKERIKRLEKNNSIMREQLEQVKRDKIEYMQNVAHQLVAPLNAIKWHIENLTEGRIGYDRAQKVLRSVYSQATIAVHLAKNFNLMSNLEADHKLSALKEPLEEVEIVRLLVNLANDFQPLAWDKNVNIKVIKESLRFAPNVLAMKSLISQVYSNIIENAVKYSHKETEIFIEGEYNKESDTVMVRVKNRGIEIAEKDEQYVFDRGFRTPEAKNAYPAGTGFGLYIARRIIELHEGSISVSTDEKRWITFTVNLFARKLGGKARRRD